VFITVLRDLTARYIGVLPCFVPPLNHTILEFKINTSINPLNQNGFFMYRQFNIPKFYVQATQCIYLFCVDLRTNCDYFPIKH